MRQITDRVLSISNMRQHSCGFSSLSVCPHCTLPRICALDPEPPGLFLCSLCVVTDGPPPPLTCDAECRVSPTEGLSWRASTPYLHKQAPYCLRCLVCHSHMTKASYVSLFGSKASTIWSSCGTVSSNTVRFFVASHTRTTSGLMVILAICWGNLSCLP